MGVFKRWSGRRKIWLFALAAAALVLAALVFFLYGAARRVYYPRQYSDEVERWSAEFNVDPLLVYAVIHTESSFKPKALSSAGARGLMQMTEDTFNWIKGKIAPNEALVFDDLFEPGTAVRFGVYYLSISLRRYGEDTKTAAAAYHSGWGTVDRLLNQAEYSQDGIVLSQFPYNQMQHYVNKVYASYTRYRELYARSPII